MTAALDLRPRRLVLAASELELLRRRTGAPALDDFAAEPGERDMEAAAAALRDRGVLVDGDAVHPSVAANLAVLSAPELVVRTRAAVDEVHVVGCHAVAGPAGASLVRSSGEAAELSLFAAADLGRELVRVVPDPGREGWPGGRLAGETVDLAALRPPPPVAAPRDDLAAAMGVSGRDLGVADALRAGARGTLEGLVVRPGSAPAVGLVLWWAVGGGWLGARAEPGAGAGRRVRLVPVHRGDYPAWMAPLIAEALA